MRIIQERQWEDWTDLRHATQGSELYSRTLSRMAERIKKANEVADHADSALVAKAVVEEREVEPEAGEGRLDVLARMEEDMNSWTPLMQDVAAGLQDMGEVATQTTANLAVDPRAKSFAGRLLIVRETAKRLQAPADRIETAGVEFAQKVSSVDQGVRIIIDSAPAEITDDPDSRESFESFFDQIRGLSLVTNTLDEQLSGFIASIAPLQKQSRDLKKPVQAATSGVTRIRTALGIIDDWIELIDGTDLPPVSVQDS